MIEASTAMSIAFIKEIILSAKFSEAYERASGILARFFFKVSISNITSIFVSNCQESKSLLTISRTHCDKIG